MFIYSMHASLHSEMKMIQALTVYVIAVLILTSGKLKATIHHCIAIAIAMSIDCFCICDY